MAIRRIKIQNPSTNKLSTNVVAMVGGGSNPMPEEISLAFDRILRVARTITDLESGRNLPEASWPDDVKALKEAVEAPVLRHHISEAIGYRNLDRSDYGTTF